jgi:S-adenosylmethionine:tRNA-ribosyltransferase-isomerase (queuine synthetase)
MKDVDAIKLIVEQYHQRLDFKSITVTPVTDEVLKGMLLVCNNTKHIEQRIDWYDDEEDLDRNIWIDVEGEGYGWIWVDKPMDTWHELIKRELNKYYDLKKTQIREREETVLIVTTTNESIYHYIERDSLKRDTIYRFSNDELYF